MCQDGPATAYSCKDKTLVALPSPLEVPTSSQQCGGKAAVQDGERHRCVSYIVLDVRTVPAEARKQVQ